MVIISGIYFFSEILFDVFRSLNCVFAYVVIAAIKQLEHITKNSCHIGSIDFLDYK